MTVSVRSENFEITKEIKVLNERVKNIGAIVSFIGQVRDFSEGLNISKMRLEHYPGMTEKSLAGIEREARSRWDILDVTIIHRIGELMPEDQIVLVLVASKHRKQSFLACEFIMDYLKISAPFWKKEITDTHERWVDAKSLDENEFMKWA